MKKKKQKYYVVWAGREPGIYSTWDECKRQVIGAKGALFKSYESLNEAERAYREGKPADSPSQGRVATGRKLENPPGYRRDTVLPLPLEVTADAWAVDAACSGNPGQMEYRGVDLATGAEVFHFGPVLGTNNIGEFLAIVHALAVFDRQGLTKTIYSDSRIAQGWVMKGKCRTTLSRNAMTAHLFEIIERAEAWLARHPVNVPLVKWRTREWGEIPADFGRK